MPVDSREKKRKRVCKPNPLVIAACLTPNALRLGQNGITFYMMHVARNVHEFELCG